MARNDQEYWVAPPVLRAEAMRALMSVGDLKRWQIVSEIDEFERAKAAMREKIYGGVNSLLRQGTQRQ